MSLVIAIVGAECSGKSTLARALVGPLEVATGERWTVVDEHLREWCDQHKRTPRSDEQAAIAAEQARRIEAAKSKGNVIADTTALMVAIYSKLLFSDPSLIEGAVAIQRGYALSVICAPDFPWQSGDWQRDGTAIQARVHAELSELQNQLAPNCLMCTGPTNHRVQSALRNLPKPRRKSHTV
jgi:nicotinamide riboside kinase